MKDKFSAEELTRIKEAVRAAEAPISGEIVPVIVPRSGFYTIANYRGGALLAIVTFLTIVIIDRYATQWQVVDPLLIFLLVLFAGVAGALLTHFIPDLKRLLLSQTHIDQSTRKRAETAFLEEEVFNTRQRTGILIFISLFEHEVIVMADKGITKVVDQKEWDRMVTTIIGYIKKGNLVDGIIVAIERSGALLLEKGFHHTGDDDRNELKDHLRIES